MQSFLFLAQTTSDSPDTGSLLLTVILLIIYVVSLWVIFDKADQPGWAAIIPIYNIIVWLRVIDRPWWWIFGLLIPIVNLIIWIVMFVELAQAFGRGAVFGCLMVILWPLLLPYLAFGGAEYVGPIRSF